VAGERWKKFLGVPLDKKVYIYYNKVYIFTIKEYIYTIDE